MFLYLGDDDVTRAAAYLSGILTHFGIPFDRGDSSDAPPDVLVTKKYDGYIISDYPAKRFRPGQMEFIRDAVADGAALLMLGGWESFHGQNGEYHTSPLAEVLPVTMQHRDDRRNCSQPVMICKQREHPILADLPWEEPPFIGGFNQFIAKPDADVLLKGLCAQIRIVDSVTDGMTGEGNAERLCCALPEGNRSLSLTFTEEVPVLVVGQYGSGKTAALATDVAPHWVGNFVDWGKQRLTQPIPGAGTIEVGEDYARFFAQLLRWLAAP